MPSLGKHIFNMQHDVSRNLRENPPHCPAHKSISLLQPRDSILTLSLACHSTASPALEWHEMEFGGGCRLARRVACERGERIGGADTAEAMVGIPGRRGAHDAAIKKVDPGGRRAAGSRGRSLPSSSCGTSGPRGSYKTVRLPSSATRSPPALPRSPPRSHPFPTLRLSGLSAGDLIFRSFSVSVTA